MKAGKTTAMTGGHKGFTRAGKGRGARALSALILCLALFFLGACSAARPRPSDEGFPREAISCDLDRAFPSFAFRDAFSAILANLLATTWDESGDWKGDLQGDATTFAPMLLYAMARDTGDLKLLAMADRTVAYEAELVKGCLYWPVPSMEVVIGIPALIQPYLLHDDPRYLPLFFTSVRLGYLSVSLSPRILTPFVRDRASAYGLMAYMCLCAGEVAQTRDQKEEFTAKGLDMIAVADKECFDAEQSLYAFEAVMDWPQETMMMALVKAYRATGDEKMLHRAQQVLGAFERKFKADGRGGYAGHKDLSTRGHSGNNNMAWVFLDLYEATGDRQYLRKAGSLLQWVLSPDLCDLSRGVIFHHVNEQSGRADYFCTGCNFHTLACIYRYNVLLSRGRQGSPAGAQPQPVFWEKCGPAGERSQPMRTHEENGAFDTRRQSGKSPLPVNKVNRSFWPQEYFGRLEECGIKQSSPAGTWAGSQPRRASGRLERARAGASKAPFLSWNNLQEE